jgi:hypothetical protein
MPETTPALLLQEQLGAAQARVETVQKHNAEGQTIEVPNTGHALSTVYEQLRNVAEYTEEHLLLQRAIRRFYRRTINFYTLQHLSRIGEELITELTLANYVHNGIFGSKAAKALDALVKYQLQTYQRLIKAHVPHDVAADWILDLLSVETEGLLNPHSSLDVLTTFAYHHYLQLLPRPAFATTRKEKQEFEISLYIAIHQALLKSDVAIVRHDLIRLYRANSLETRSFIRFNQMVSRLYTSSLTGRLSRAVSKYGAPMRILKNLIEERPDLPALLDDKQAFLDAFDMQTRLEYRQGKRRLNRGFKRSVAFLFITKVLVGVAIEIPYDLLVAGSVVLMPLVTNILFPPVYLALLRLGIKPPSSANAAALHHYIDKALFTNDSPLVGPLRVGRRTTSVFASVFYGVLFLVPFGIIISILSVLGFNIIQGFIFFVFLCTASFLGFRLSRIVSELELVTKQSGFIEASRDFFYLPFIVAGGWVSSKYAQVNVMAFVLDIAIELPLKSILRLARQWTAFVREKREQL